jgi:uncharacterized protein YecT (DUF1311 family)
MTNFFRFLLVSLAFTLGTTIVAHAASFDCSKATTETEIAICNDPELSALDELVNASYILSKRDLSNEGKILSEQREWLKERDQISSNYDKNNYYSQRDNLYHFMSKRIGILLETAVGTEYEKVKNQLIKSEMSVFHFSEPKRVILFSPKIKKSGYQYTLNIFFDANQKLAKVFIGDIPEFKNHIEEDFSFGPTYDENLAQLRYTQSHRYGYVQFIYSLGESCIELSGYTNSPDILEGEVVHYKFKNAKKICLEEYSYDFYSEESLHQFVPVGGYHYYDLKQFHEEATKRGLIEFLIQYWLYPPVSELNCPDSKTNPVALTRLKLINLFQHFSKNETNQSELGLNYRKQISFFGGGWYWDGGYVPLIDTYKKNQGIFDLFLPILKLLDDKNHLEMTVDFLINYHENPDLIIPKFVDNSPTKAQDGCEHGYWHGYFEIKNDLVTATVWIEPHHDILRKPFWERRRSEGNAEITLELLYKIKAVLRSNTEAVD